MNAPLNNCTLVHVPRCIAAVAALAAGATAGLAAAPAADRLPQFEYLATDYRNPARPMSQVKITVPTIPDCVSAIWCYEGLFPEGKGERRPDGSFVLRSTQDGMTAETLFTPLPNAVDVKVTIDGPVEQLRSKVAGRVLNPCWQHFPSKLFGSGTTWKDGGFEEDFVPRCFIFTVRGLTRLDDTVRFAWRTAKPNLHERSNNPPWVQDYIGLTHTHEGNRLGVRSVSTDRPVLPIIGVVSRDGKWLQAWAWPRDYHRLGQVWRDCLHPTPVVEFNPRTNRVESHGKIYFMENDPDKLLAAFFADFGAEVAPAISLEAEGGTVLIRSRDVPGGGLKLTLPRMLGGVPQAELAGLQWRRRPWGTLQAQARMADGKGTLHLWVHPTDRFVELNMTLANSSARPLSTTLEVEVDARAATETGGTVARLLLEGGGVEPAEPGVLRMGTQFAGVIPGAYHTLRGRLLFAHATAEDLQARATRVVEEWNRAQPYLVPPPAGSR